MYVIGSGKCISIVGNAFINYWQMCAAATLGNLSGLRAH